MCSAPLGGVGGDLLAVANIVVVASFAPLATPSTPPVAPCPNILGLVLCSTAVAYVLDQISWKGAEPIEGYYPLSVTLEMRLFIITLFFG